MPDSFVDEVVQSNAPSRARAPQSAPIELVEGEGGRAKPTAPPAPSNDERNTGDDIPAPGTRVLPASVKEKFAAIKAARAAEAPVDDDPDAPPGEAAAPADGGEASNAAPADTETDPDAPPGEAPKPAEAKVEAAPAADDPVAKLQAELARREAANRKLYEENETLKKRAPELAPADKLLKEAASSYLDDEQAALRKFIAAGLGVADPNAPEVDQELRDLYGDLTAKELGVTPDAAHQAKRDAARTRRQWEREKRERKAQEQSSSAPSAQDEQAKAEQEAAPFIDSVLTAKAADFPLISKLSQKLDGLPPGIMVAKLIRREIQTGRLEASGKSDEELVIAAAKIAESHYQALRDEFSKASPSPSTQPSTAQPNGKPSAAASSARPDTRQSHGARTLTAADASVAPATPPAPKPAKKDDKPPQFKTDDERRKWALRHLRQPKRQ